MPGRTITRIRPKSPRNTEGKEKEKGPGSRSLPGPFHLVSVSASVTPEQAFEEAGFFHRLDLAVRHCTKARVAMEARTAPAIGFATAKDSGHAGILSVETWRDNSPRRAAVPVCGTLSGMAGLWASQAILAKRCWWVTWFVSEAASAASSSLDALRYATRPLRAAVRPCGPLSADRAPTGNDKGANLGRDQRPTARERAARRCPETKASAEWRE